MVLKNQYHYIYLLYGGRDGELKVITNSLQNRLQGA